MNDQKGPGPEKATVERVRAGKAVCKKYDLTPAQMGVLRHASRKYESYVVVPGQEPKLYNGEVSTWGVRQDTIDLLCRKGYVARGFHIAVAQQRVELEGRANALVEQAFQVAREHSPFKVIKGHRSEVHQMAWLGVLSSLQAAHSLHEDLRKQNWQITDAGRAVAAEFKQAIGAEEE